MILVWTRSYQFRGGSVHYIQCFRIADCRKETHLWNGAAESTSGVAGHKACFGYAWGVLRCTGYPGRRKAVVTQKWGPGPLAAWDRQGAHFWAKSCLKSAGRAGVEETIGQGWMIPCTGVEEKRPSCSRTRSAGTWGEDSADISVASSVGQSTFTTICKEE